MGGAVPGKDFLAIIKQAGFADAEMVSETGLNSSPVTKGVLFRLCALPYKHPIGDQIQWIQDMVCPQKRHLTGKGLIMTKKAISLYFIFLVAAVMPLFALTQAVADSNPGAVLGVDQ